MKLLKTSFYTSISTAVTFLSGFIVTKVVAIKIGPAGMTYVGQYQNGISIIAMLSTLAISSGVVKYLAQYKDEPAKKQQIVDTALGIILISSITLTLVVLFGHKFLSDIIFHSNEYADVILFYGFFIVIIATNTLVTAFYNGLKEIKYLTAVNIFGSLAGICFTVVLAINFGVKGVLIANNFTALTICIINIYILRKKNFFNYKPSLPSFNRDAAKLLLGYTVIGISTGILTPLSQILIRNKIVSIFTLTEAGWWQAVTRISDYYLAFITTVLSIYYLPKLSEINDKSELRQEISRGYKGILPVVALMALAIWIFRETIVQVLFSKEFLPMTPLFKFQLLGDFFKIGSWLLGYILIAKANIKLVIITELAFASSLVIMSYYFINTFGIIGTTYAFCLNYALHWITMVFITRKYLF